MLKPTQEIQLRVIEGEPRVSSRDMAERLGVEHKNTLELLRTYESDFENFGHLAFQTETVRNRVGAANQARTAFLNEDQSYLLLTFVRNTPQARALKVGLVKAFRAAREALLEPNSNQLRLPTSPLEILRVTVRALEEIETRTTNHHLRLQRVEQELASGPINNVERGIIYRLGQEWGRSRGSFHAAWRDFNHRYEIASYRDLPRSRFVEARDWLKLQIAAHAAASLFEQDNDPTTDDAQDVF